MKLRRKSKAMFMGRESQETDFQETVSQEQTTDSAEQPKSTPVANDQQPEDTQDTSKMNDQHASNKAMAENQKSKDKDEKKDAKSSSKDDKKAGVGFSASASSSSESSSSSSSGEANSYGEVPPIGSTADFSGYDQFRYREGIGDVNERDTLEDFLTGEGELGALPLPEVFNAYPPEVQRKIMEWTDRDVKARRDDESRRQDEITRAMVDRNRRSQSIPAIIVVLALICGAVTSIVTGNPLSALVFMIVPVVVVIARIVSNNDSDDSNKPPRLPRA